MPAKKYIVRLDREERQYLNRLVHCPHYTDGYLMYTQQGIAQS